jgi:hypothetical protein
MPYYQEIKRLPPVVDALRSFEYIKKRRKDEEKFTDDLADFRFWSCAAFAVFSTDMPHKPSLGARQRQRAANAAKLLIKLVDTTNLLSDSSLSDDEGNELKALLSKIHSVKSISRRPRSDKFTDDRMYLERLTDFVWRTFGDCPPALIVHFSPLQLQTPDRTAITKLVAARARELRSGGTV